MPIFLTSNFLKATAGRSITVNRYRQLLAPPCLLSKDGLGGGKLQSGSLNISTKALQF